MLFHLKSDGESNTKEVEDFRIFPTGIYFPSSDQRFRSYGILKIDFTAEFCFWTEQRLNGSQLLGLELTEIPEVLNTIMVGNSLRFSMVYSTAPND
jgi:hypothetical protein